MASVSKMLVVAKSSTVVAVFVSLVMTPLVYGSEAAIKPGSAQRKSCEIVLNRESLNNPKVADLTEEEALDALIRHYMLNPPKGDFLNYRLTEEQKALIEDLIKSWGREKTETLLARALDFSKDFTDSQVAQNEGISNQQLGTGYTRAIVLVQREPKVATKAVDEVLGEENILYNPATVKIFEEILRKKGLLASEHDLKGRGLFKRKKRAIEAYEQDKIRLEGLAKLEIRDQLHLAEEIYLSLFEGILHLSSKELEKPSTEIVRELTESAKKLNIKLKNLTEIRESLREMLQHEGGRDFMIELVRVSLPNYGKLLLGSRPSRATKNRIYWSTHIAQMATAGLLAFATKDMGYLALGVSVPLLTSWIPGVFHGPSVSLASKLQNWIVRRQTRTLLNNLVGKNALTVDGTIVNGDYKIIQARQKQIEDAFFAEHIAALEPRLSPTTNTFEIQKYGEEILYARTLLATRLFTGTAQRGAFSTEYLSQLKGIMVDLQTDRVAVGHQERLKELVSSLSQRREQILSIISDTETLLGDVQISQEKAQQFDRYLSEEIDIYIKNKDPFFQTSEEIFSNKQIAVRQAVDDLKALGMTIDKFRASINHELEQVEAVIRLISLGQVGTSSQAEQEIVLEAIRGLARTLEGISIF